MILAARSKARTLLDHSNTRTANSNPAQSTDGCLRFSALRCQDCPCNVSTNPSWEYNIKIHYFRKQFESEPAIRPNMWNLKNKKYTRLFIPLTEHPDHDKTYKSLCTCDVNGNGRHVYEECPTLLPHMDWPILHNVGSHQWVELIGNSWRIPRAP